MSKLLKTLEAIALIAFSGVCVALALLAVSASRAVKKADAQLAVVSQKVSLDLGDVHRLILEAGLTAMEARKASAEERAALPALTARADASLDDLNALLVSARRTSDGVAQSEAQIAGGTVTAIGTVNETVRQIQPAVVQADRTIAELQTVEADLDHQVNDPSIAQTLKHLDDGSAALAASAADVQQEVHSITHPTWVHRIWGWSLDVAHVFNPL